MKRRPGGLGPPTVGDAERKALAEARRNLGKRAEQIACDYLGTLGFDVVARNVRVGRLELDIIARRGRLLVFCEVRSLTSSYVMTPAQSIDRGKVTRLRQAASQWLRENPQARHAELRFDVASVLFDTPDGRLNYLEGAF